VTVRNLSAEHAEWGIGATEQADSGHDQGANQQDAGAGSEHAHQAAPLPGRIGEDGAGLMPACAW